MQQAMSDLYGGVTTYHFPSHYWNRSRPLAVTYSVLKSILSIFYISSRFLDVDGLFFYVLITMGERRAGRVERDGDYVFLSRAPPDCRSCTVLCRLCVHSAQYGTHVPALCTHRGRVGGHGARFIDDLVTSSEGEGGGDGPGPG